MDAGADGDKNAPRPAPMEQDTDIFKQKIRLLNESAKRARTESNVDHSALLERVDGLLGEANALFLKNSNTSDIINIDSRVFDRRVGYGKRVKFGDAKENSVVVANIDQFGPATNRFSGITSRERNCWFYVQ